MGREVRMVPAGWEHPRDDNGKLIPLMCGDWAEAFADWQAEKAKWDDGLVKDWSVTGGGWKPRDEGHGESFEDWTGACPNHLHYMPVFAPGTATMMMMYEDTSEGTPISPAFATAEELARWLADNGASSFGSMTATYDQWLKMIKNTGWAPSMVMDSHGLRSGVAAITED